MKKLNLSVLFFALSLGLLALMLGGCGSGPTGPGPEPEPETRAWLKVQAVPPADIIINGKDTGKDTPAIVSVNAGEHEVIVQRQGWDGWKQTIAVTSENIGDTLLVQFDPLLARIGGSITDDKTGNPVQGTIYVDVPDNSGWTLAGSTTNLANGTFLLKLQPGPYRVRAEVEGSEPMSVELTVGEDGVITGKLQFLAKTIPVTGAIRVQTTPPGATVFVDGAEVGLSPFERDGYSPGPHTVKIILNGYEETERTLEVVIGRTTAWSPTLKLLPRVIDFFPTEPTVWRVTKIVSGGADIILWRVGNKVYFGSGYEIGTITDEGYIELNLWQKIFKGNFYRESMEVRGEVTSPNDPNYHGEFIFRKE